MQRLSLTLQPSQQSRPRSGQEPVLEARNDLYEAPDLESHLCVGLLSSLAWKGSGAQERQTMGLQDYCPHPYAVEQGLLVSCA